MNDLELARQDKPITREQLILMGNEGLEMLNEGFKMKFIDKICFFSPKAKRASRALPRRMGRLFRRAV